MPTLKAVNEVPVDNLELLLVNGDYMHFTVQTGEIIGDDVISIADAKTDSDRFRLTCQLLARVLTEWDITVPVPNDTERFATLIEEGMTEQDAVREVGTHEELLPICEQSCLMLGLKTTTAMYDKIGDVLNPPKPNEKPSSFS